MEEIDLIEIFQTFWRRKIQMILIILIFIVIGYIYTTKYVTPMYSSSTTLVLASTDNKNATNTITASDITINSKLIATYKELIKSKSIINEVITNLGININEEELRKNISITSVTDTSLIEIKVTDSNPENTAKIANEIAKVFSKKIAEIYNINNIQNINEANIPTAPYNINHKKDILKFTLIGIVVAIVSVLILETFDTTIKSEEELERMFQLPILVSIPMYTNNKKTTKGKRGNKSK